tara:strand:+ start:2901 stop:3917 length:1017 start_codon:yes stop_codon:yes gene_type:complete
MIFQYYTDQGQLNNMSRDRSRSSDWNNARRPRVSNRLSLPNRRDGSDGDLQIRQTNLGAKLFGKIGGEWHSTFLSSEEEVIGTSGTKIGMSSSGALSVDQILLTGKISLTSTGTQNVCIGTNNSDIGTKNIVIGVDAGSSISSPLGAANICIGISSGKAITTGIANTLIGNRTGESITTTSYNVYVGHQTGLRGTSTYNAGVGYGSLPALLGGQTNTALGFLSGMNIEAGAGNIMIGERSGINGSDVTESICIGGLASATADNAIALGLAVTNTVANSCKIACTGGLYLDGVISLKEQSDDVADIAGYSQIWVDDAGDGILMFTDDNGTKYTVDVTAV